MRTELCRVMFHTVNVFHPLIYEEAEQEDTLHVHVSMVQESLTAGDGGITIRPGLIRKI